METFHQRLARIAFDAGDELGLVLAGGYAVSAHHLTDRPSRDLDFATASRRRAVAKITVLPPDVVPMSKEDEQQAIHAISAMIEQWWREHGRVDDAPETHHGR